MLSAVIREIVPVQMGSALCVALTLCGDGGSEEKSFIVSDRQYAELPCLHPYEKAAGRRLTQEQVVQIEQAAVRHAAVSRALNLLSYGDLTEQTLVRKLLLRGIDRDAAEFAAAAMVEGGYINEEDQIEGALRVCLRKGWGPLRIVQALRQKGFSRDVLETLPDRLAEIDFAARCAEVIERKWGSLPTDRLARQKAIAALMRLGYTREQIGR
ncbi:MAG: RecX family transcriptional regulator [Clostridia bacterium]|nr:RecX family transcriptional regulator [Clostridia bacterium]